MEAGRPAATQSPRPSCGDLSSAEPRRAFVVGQGPGGRPRQRNWTCKKEKKETPRSARVRGLTPRHVGESTSPQARAAGGGGKRYGARGGQVTRHARRVARAGGPRVRAPPPPEAACAPRASVRARCRAPPTGYRTRQPAPATAHRGGGRCAAHVDVAAPPSGGISPVPTAWMDWGLSRVVFAVFVSLFG